MSACWTARGLFTNNHTACAGGALRSSTQVLEQVLMAYFNDNSLSIGNTPESTRPKATAYGVNTPAATPI